MLLYQTEVLVIGGGATGTGVVRDLAMRGFKAILVEKGDLTHGTSGRYHGLLHSGGRYAVKDSQAAKECIQENRILRRIMPHCIEDTGGFFVTTPWDDPEYVPQFADGCKQAGIPIESVSVAEMLRKEPKLNHLISHCFYVPDGSADSFLAADTNADSARQYGAIILNYHRVEQILTKANQARGAVCTDIAAGEKVTINADLVINAAGAWAGRIAALVDAPLNIIPGKGVMIAANHRIVNTVINRCKIPSDGDILVPAHTVAVIGTTDVHVNDPDHFAIDPWEIDLLLDEGEKIVPGFKEMRMLRAWAGVRPLYQTTNTAGNREVTRAFVLIDHAKRDGIENLITITSGKWTTYRKMAEETVDLACKKLGVERACRTHIEPLPGAGVHGKHYLGLRLAKIEANNSYGDLICECELATFDDVSIAILERQAKTLDDIRRDVRLGMGPCQGGFCTFRAAGILHKLQDHHAQDTNIAIRDFLQERWKGLLPVLWGQQLRQERLNEFIYGSLLNANHLPGPITSALSPVLYQKSSNKHTKSPAVPIDYRRPAETGQPGAQSESQSATHPPNLDVLIVGAGLAGLTAASQLVRRGKSVRVISKGWGTLYWHSGCIDIIGYIPQLQETPIRSPREALSAIFQKNPSHPYTLAGTDQIEGALNAFKAICVASNYNMQGTLDNNWLLPTAIGTLRPTCLAPETMISGDVKNKSKMLIVGFERYHDFYPDWIAANLIAQDIPAIAITLDLPILKNHTSVNNRLLANYFDNPEFRHEVVKAIKHNHKLPKESRVDRVGFPAVLGLAHSAQAQKDLEESLGLPIFEIPTLPPSIPGMRLHKLLVSYIENGNGQVFDGMQILSSNTEIGPAGNLPNSPVDRMQQLISVSSEAAARHMRHAAKNFILATGGILGGGLRAVYHSADRGAISEDVFNLQIQAPGSRSEWLDRQFIGGKSHPIYSSGVSTNQDFQPTDRHNNILYSNLYAIGASLADAECVRELSYEGVALVTGYSVGCKI